MPRCLVLLAVPLASACSGRSTLVRADAAGAPAFGGHAGSGGHAGTGGRGGSGGKAPLAGTGGSADVPYDDPGCPDASAPSPSVECDVFDQVSGCPAGLACKPSIEHPFGSGCDKEVIDLRCLPPGAGQQGDACDQGTSACAEGFICVIGASHGAHCLRMCPLDGSVGCPSGYVCGATDADGIGVCT